MKRYKYCILFVFFSVFFLTECQVSAALKYTAFDDTNWTTLTEVTTQLEKGWLQSVCATDQYIV